MLLNISLIGLEEGYYYVNISRSIEPIVRDYITLGDVRIIPWTIKYKPLYIIETAYHIEYKNVTSYVLV